MLTHSLVLAATALSTCALPQGDITDPHTWGDYFLNKYATERADAMTIEPAPTPPLEHPRTVLLITGVTIPAAWFDPIKARLERDGFHTVVYEPPALLSGDLFENSQWLAQEIDQIRAQTGEERIDILAECTGGLISRYYIQSLGGDAHVRRLVTFISPQHGLPKAELAQSFVDWQAVKDLTPGSAFLEAVNDAPMAPDVPVTSIYTCTDEYIQPFETSSIPGAKNINLCDGTFVGHFQFFYDVGIYNLMHDELVAPAPTDASSQPPTPPSPPPADDPNDGAAATTDGGCAASGGQGGLVVLGTLTFAVRRRRRADHGKRTRSGIFGAFGRLMGPRSLASCLVLLLGSACTDHSMASGEDTLVQLSASEVTDLCAQMASIEMAPRDVDCGSGASVTLKSVDECVAGMQALKPSCTATEMDALACAHAIETDPCSLGGAPCAWAFSCAG